MHNTLKNAISEDGKVGLLPDVIYQAPTLDPLHYYRDVAVNPFFHLLSILRHHIKAETDFYFSEQVHAKNIDLFMLTSSISSPFGPGSDSEPIPLNFGGLSTYLVDSSQFGFEPLVQNGTERAYCYLPSLRGENPDSRHLNQFYHCEYEGQMGMEETKKIAEQYVKQLAQLLLSMPNLLRRLSLDYESTAKFLLAVIECPFFTEISFDNAVDLLVKNGHDDKITHTKFGKTITSEGERVLLTLLKSETPIWLTHHYRDSVPFYQKPSSQNPDRSLSADLLVPPISVNGFSGEILGLGERQSDVNEMYKSIQRQGIDVTPYEWYIDLRRLPNYKTTSGFGLGIERFIAWSLGFDNIANCILYPRLKGVMMYP